MGNDIFEKKFEQPVLKSLQVVEEIGDPASDGDSIGGEGSSSYSSSNPDLLLKQSFPSGCIRPWM